MGKKRKEEWKRVGGGENVPAPILKATAGASRVDPFLIGELHRATSHVWALHRDVDLAYVDRHRYINQGHSERPTPEGRRESKNLLEASTASTVIPRVEHAIPPALRRAGATAAGACRPRRQPARTSRCLGPGGTPWPPPRHGGPSRWRRPSFLRRTDRGHGRGPALWRRMVAPRTYAGGVRANR